MSQRGMDTEKQRGGEKETERDKGNKDIKKKQKERCGIREYDIEKYKDM